MPRETLPKKPSGIAIAVGLGPKGGMPRGGNPPPPAEEEEEYGESDAHEAAFASLADALGIAPEKRASAQAALKTFVRACMREYGSEE